MGYAHGELLTEKAQSMLNSVWEYLEQQIVSSHSLLRSDRPSTDI